MGLTVTEDTPADMLAGNMELLVQLPPRTDNDYDDNYEEDEETLHHQHHRNHRDRHHNHHHNNGHHPRRATTNGINARRVTVARSTPMMDLLVQVATSQKLSASSYTLEAIGEHGLVLTHHPNTPIGALDALQVKLLPKQGTFAPVKTRHANQPFEPTFRLQVHLPRNQLYVSRVSSRMNLGKILEEVCREKNLDRSNYELCHPANLEEKLDISLSLQDYHLQEVTLCPKRRSLGSSLSSQDIMALQRQEERRRQDARHSVFGFAFKKSKESSVSTDSLGERSISPARSDGTGRSASPLQVPTAPTRPQRKRRPAPKPPMLQREQEQNSDLNNGVKETGKEKEIEKEKIVVISHSRNSSDSSGYHEASVLSDNLDSNIRIPETLPRRSKAQPQPLEPPPRTLAETSQASKSLGNLAFVPTNNRPSIARGTSNTSLVSTGLRKKKAAPAPPQPRPLSSAISTQALERIVDSEESLTSGGDSPPAKASSDVAATSRPSLVTSQSLSSDDSEPITVTTLKMETENNNVANPPSPEEIKKEEPAVVEKPTPKKRSTVVQPFVAIAEGRDQFDVAETATEIVTHNVEPARDRKRGKLVRSRSSIDQNVAAYSFVSRYSLENVIEHQGEVNEAVKSFAKTVKPIPAKRAFLSRSSAAINEPPENPRAPPRDRSFRRQEKVRDIPKSYSFNYSRAQKQQPPLRRSPRSYESPESLKSATSYLKPNQSSVAMMLDLENISPCGLLESRFSPKRSHTGNYICDEKCQVRMIKQSLSFQSTKKLKETKISNSFERSGLTASRSFNAKTHKLPEKAPKLGDLSVSMSYNDPRISTREIPPFQNSTPFPLSNLQIFAISTKPDNIQAVPKALTRIVVPEIKVYCQEPSDNETLPSLPLVEDCSNGTKNRIERKVSIFKPPPPGLVSRQESNENWNNFLIRLNSILESRTGVPVPVPKPRNKLVTSYTPMSESPKVHPLRELEVPIINKSTLPMHREIIEPPAMNTQDLHVESTHRITVGSDKKNYGREEERRRHSLITNDIGGSVGRSNIVPKEHDHNQELVSDTYGENNDHETSRHQPPKKPRRKTVGGQDPELEEKLTSEVDVTEKQSKVRENNQTIEKRPTSEPRISGVPNVLIQSWNASVKQAVRNKRVSEKFAQLQGKFNEPQSLPIYLTTDIRRSCAVISTIPKCDHFEGPITMRKNASQSMESKKDSSLGSSFGARKIILDSSHQRDDQKKAFSMMNLPSDELELEDISLEMFEESKRPRNWSKLLRSNSGLNNFEINTFEGSGRPLTSKSVDFTFALNPNLSRNISDLSTDSYPKKYSKKYFDEDDSIASEDINSEWKSSPATDLSQFFRGGISWERRQMFLPAGGQEYEARQEASTVGESVPAVDDGRIDLTTPITGAEATSDLLKKVSDTLSGSSRSPAVALISTSGNVSPKQQQLKVCVDAPGASRIQINQAQPIADGNLIQRDVTNSSEKSFDEKLIDSNIPDDLSRGDIKDALQDSVQNESLDSAGATDWEYQLPEPPTAFRDTKENENRERSATISLGKSSADEKPKDLAVNTDSEISNNVMSPTLDEKTKSRKNEVVSATQSPKTSTSINEVINSGTNFQPRTLDSATLERRRVSRSGTVKSQGDSAARRPSHAVSTPSVAPVDNPLSNFTITTYSRPKPVEIFNEIEQRDDELQPGVLGRKGSAGQTESFAAVPQQNRRHTAIAIFVTKNASQSSKTYMTLPRNEKNVEPEVTPKKITPAVAIVKKEVDDQQVQIDSDANNTNVSRSNIRISIATKPRPRANTLTEIVLSKNKTLDVINGNEAVGSSEEQRDYSAPESNEKFSQSGESILKKQETPDKEKQLQSLEILKSILPQLEGAQKTLRDDGTSENTDSVPSKETRSVNDIKNEPPTDENPKNSVPAAAESTKTSEPKVKRYTYSGPPAIDLGSWSDRSRTKVQIKPDSDYKFEKSKSPEIITPAQTPPAPINRESPPNAVPKIGTTSVIIQNETPAPVFPVQPAETIAAKNSGIDIRGKEESNELAKTLIARTTATGFMRRPVSAVFEPSGVSTLTRLRKKEPEEEKVVEAQGRLRDQAPEKDEVDSRPINFKQLKETFGKEQPTNSQSRPNYGTYGRPKSEYNTSGSAVRRNSSVTLSNGESERVAPISNYSTLQRISTNGTARVLSGAENTKVQEKPASVLSQEKRNFVVSTNRVSYNQVSEATGPGEVRRASRGNLMPVVKGFKVTTLEGEGAVTLPNNKDKQRNNYGRVAIGDISNGNYVATHNGLKKTVVQIRGDDFTNGIPKPPPTMPVITGVTLKSTNASNSRPKSVGGQSDPRSELLEAIKGFGGTNQLRRVPRRSMQNISGIQI